MSSLRYGAGAIAGLFALLVVAQARQPTLTIDVGGSGDARFLRGFRAPIVGQRVSFRWTGPDAELRIHGLACAACTLDLRTDAGAGTEPLHVHVVRPASGDAPLADITVSSGWQTDKVELGPEALEGESLAGPTVLGLRTERYRRDADGKEVGFKLDSARLTCSAASWRAIATRSALLTWGLAISWLLLLLLVRHLPDRLARIAPPLVHVVLGAASVGLLVAVATRPFLAAWAFAPMPVSCTLVTLILVALRWAPATRRALAQLLAASTHRPTMRRLAIVLALGGLLWSYLRLGHGLGLPLALAAAALVILLTIAHESSRAASEAPIGRAALVLAVLLVLVIAFGLRLYGITETPTGMWRDEARHGLAALNIIEDPHYRPVYVPQADLAAAGLYGFIPGLLLWGATPWALRIPSALAGALTVLPLMFVTRRLTGRTDTALLAGGLLAASSSHATVSRLGFVGELHPLFELSGLALLALGLTASRSRLARVLLLAAGGASLALALQMYQSGRLAPVVAALFLVLVLGLRASWRGIFGLWPALGAFALVALPVTLYAIHRPDVVQSRTAETFLLSRAATEGDAPLAALDASVHRHLLMLHVRGDDIGRHNLPGQPHLGPIAGLGFMAGLLLLVERRRDGSSAFLLAVCLLTTVPSLLSVDGPRTTRILDLLPYAAIVAAVGWTERLWPSLALTSRKVAAVATLSILAAASGAWSLFVAAPSDPAVWRSFDTSHTRLGLALQEIAAREGTPLAHIYLPADVQPNEVVRYLAHGLGVGTYDASGLWPRPDDSHARVRLVVRHGEDEAAAERLAERLGRRPRFAGLGPRLPDGEPAFRIVALE